MYFTIECLFNYVILLVQLKLAFYHFFVEEMMSVPLYTVSLYRYTLHIFIVVCCLLVSLYTVCLYRCTLYVSIVLCCVLVSLYTVCLYRCTQYVCIVYGVCLYSYIYCAYTVVYSKTFDISILNFKIKMDG